MKIFSESNGVPVKAWIESDIEDSAIKQISNVSKLPFIHSHIAIMPDVHAGYGATIGSVIPTVGAIIPSAVGVDIGCGMIAVRTSLSATHLPDNLSSLRSLIESAIPHGRTDNGGNNDKGKWDRVPIIAMEKFYPLNEGLEQIIQQHPSLEKASLRAHKHMGTLGTGNHFIEICLDQNNDVWVMLHSGSRGIGNAIGSYFIELAKQDMRKWFINLPDVDLAYLPEGTNYFNDYLMAVSWAQDYAYENRRLMMDIVLGILNENFKSFMVMNEAINCHHNYVEKENHFGKNVWITRKGALRARKTDLGIIPGSMGAKSFIVRGKGNKDSFDSCSHGAGRKMSRTQARNLFTLQEHELATKGIECRKDIDVIDETPMAYKDIDSVMNAQSDLVEILYTLKQVLCVKG